MFLKQLRALFSFQLQMRITVWIAVRQILQFHVKHFHVHVKGYRGAMLNLNLYSIHSTG